MAYASRYLVVDFWLLIILFIAASAIFSITVCIHNWSMPCHATLYHVMAFDRCSSVIINSYSLAAIHSTAICFISYQQFFYLFFFFIFRCCFLSIWLYAAADLLRSFCSLFFRQSVVVAAFAAVVVGFFFGTFRIF